MLQLDYITLHYTALHYINCTSATPHHATLHYIRLGCATACNTTAHYITLRYTRYTTPQLQLELDHTNCITLQLQLQTPHYTTTTAAHHTTSSSCGSGDHCNHCYHSKKHNSNHLSVHQWIRSAINASQQLTSPIVSYLWDFRHRLVRY